MLHTSGGLEVAGSVVALGEKDAVIGAALEGLVEGNGSTHKLFLNLSKTVETGLELEVVVAIALGDGGHDGDVVALGANVVGRRYDCDVDIYLYC